jgi:4-hydroxy-tetrahydrodipicolinate synthase
LSGLIVPVITPVDEGDRVDEKAFRQLLRRLIAAGVDGLFVGGSAGEGPLLAAFEWRRMIGIARDEVAAKLPLLGGAMDTSTRRILERVEALASCGYEYFVVAPSYYIALRDPGEHLRLFSRCVEGGRGMKMIAYNIPSCTASQIPVEVITELARVGAIEYCKESSGDMAYFKRLVEEGGKHGLKVFMGDEPCISEGLKAGAGGIVPVCANVEPETFIRACAAARRGDWDGLAAAQDRIAILRQNLVGAGSNWISGIKEALATLGCGSGRPVSPLEPLTPEQRRKVAAFMHSKRIESTLPT